MIDASPKLWALNHFLFFGEGGCIHKSLFYAWALVSFAKSGEPESEERSVDGPKCGHVRGMAGSSSWHGSWCCVGVNMC